MLYKCSDDGRAWSHKELIWEIPVELRRSEAILFAVADGSDKIELVEAEGPDIVILNLDWPIRDGFDLLK